MRSDLSTATKGALGELIVAADLLAKGCAVFRAMSPACACDLMVLQDGEERPLRIEVRTGRYVRGELTWSKERFRADLFAVVVFRRGKPEVFYRPGPDMSRPYTPPPVRFPTRYVNGKAVKSTVRYPLRRHNLSTDLSTSISPEVARE